MDVLSERCAGLDVRRSMTMACVLLPRPGQPVVKRVQPFGAAAPGLAALVAGRAVGRVAMQGTGVYWMPVRAAGGLTPVVVNAQHIKAVPGRKTDVNDAGWIARLVRYGLVRAGFVPAQPIRALRDPAWFHGLTTPAAAAARPPWRPDTSCWCASGPC